MTETDVCAWATSTKPRKLPVSQSALGAPAWSVGSPSPPPTPTTLSTFHHRGRLVPLQCSAPGGACSVDSSVRARVTAWAEPGPLRVLCRSPGPQHPRP